MNAICSRDELTVNDDHVPSAMIGTRSGQPRRFPGHTTCTPGDRSRPSGHVSSPAAYESLTPRYASVLIDSMNDDWMTGLRDRARRHAALGDVGRLAVVEELLRGDSSPSRLGMALGMGSNLLAHHLQVLERAGLIRRVRSQADRRRSYLTLVHDALEGLTPTAVTAAARVLFVCTENAARSQLAAAIWSDRSEVPVTSAGTHPAARVHPGAVDAARAPRSDHDRSRACSAGRRQDERRPGCHGVRSGSRGAAHGRGSAALVGPGPGPRRHR